MADRSDEIALCVNCANLLRVIDRLSSERNEEADRQEALRIAAEQERLDILKASRANKSRWKNARRDFLDVRAERDTLRARVAELEMACTIAHRLAHQGGYGPEDGNDADLVADVLAFATAHYGGEGRSDQENYDAADYGSPDRGVR